jgi:hypothetical protein
MGEQIKIDPKRFGGPSSQKRTQEEAQTTGTQTSTARGQADLPYIAPTAQAQLDRLMLQNEDLQRQLDKAKKGEPLAGDDKTRLITDVDAYEKLMSAIDGFNPDFVGTVADFPGQIENFLQSRVSGDLGTPGQADFWSQMKFLDMLTRNKYFGASLTGNEKQSYAETTISPGMTPEAALTNLERRAATLRTGIQRNVRSLTEGGYRPAQINAQLGQYLPDLNPRWMTAEDERLLGEYASREDFDPAVYKQMLLQFGDANGLRIDPAAAEAAADTVIKERAAGNTSFSGAAVYQGLEEPKEDDQAAAAGAADGTAGGGGAGGGEGLGWGETLMSGLVNLPRSTAEEVSGIFEAFTSPIQTAKSLGSLGGALLSKMGVADFDESSADALGQYYANKYGSIEGFKKELANNPASILADAATILTGGAGVVTKLGLPAKIASLGNKAAVAQRYAGLVARNIDPITAMTNIITEVAPAAARVAGKGTGKLATTALGLTTGAGGDAITEAAKVGFERGAAGAPTNASDAFLSAMRDPSTSSDEIVQLARDAVGNLRQQASQRYMDTMARFGKNPVPLDVSRVRQRIADIKPKSYDTWRDSQGPRPLDHRAWETMTEFVDEYAYKATQDPSLLEPLAMDQFKQDLYDIGSKVGGPYDRDAARIAGTAYGAVKDELVKHDPLYADAMKDYEKAATQAQQLESTFGLAAARGKKPNIESAGRKLSQSLRNNVNTNFGTRRAQVDELSELDPTGRLLPSLAGQTLNALEPRGLGRLTSGAALTSGLTGIGLNMVPMAMDVPGYLSGANLAALPLMSPRVVGETAYYAGRGAGTAANILEPVTTRVASAADRLASLQQQYRDPLVYGGFAAQNIAAMQGGEPLPVEEPVGEEVITPEAMRIAAEQPALGDLTSKYAGDMVDVAGNEVAPAEAPGPKAGDTIVIDNRDAVYDPTAGAYIFVDTGEIARKAMQRGGMVRGYNRGGTALRDRARSVGQGVTFGFGDELEGGVRALGRAISEGDLMALQQKYLQERDMVRAQQKAYEDANPIESLLYEGGGAMLTGLVPGAQGATAARMAQLAARSPKAARAAAVAADTALYGAGSAESVRDIPRSIRDEALFAVPMYGGAEGVRAGVNRYRARKGKKR